MFNSSVVGTKFGRGADPQKEWTCICSAVNRRYFTQCQLCGIKKSLAELAKAEDSRG